MSINQRILSIIKSEKGLTQKGMAAAIGISASTLNNWLKIGTPVPAEYILPIAKYLSVSPLYLLTGKEEDRTLSDEDSEWLSLIHQLPEEAKPVVKGMIQGYIKNA